MRLGLAVTGGYAHGVYFTRSAGLVVIRTSREPGVVVSVTGDRCTLPDGSIETRRADGVADYARWAVRLGIELGVGVEMQIHTGSTAHP